MAGAAIEPAATAARRVANFICFTPYFDWLCSLLQNPQPFDGVPFHDGNETNRAATLMDGGAENRPCQRGFRPPIARARSEEHTSELQSLMRSSYAVLCVKKKNRTNPS